MPGGIADLFQTVSHPLLIINISRCYGCHSNDSIHWRAYLMAHPGKEIRFCPICAFRCGQGILQGFGLLCQLFVHLPKLRHIRDVNKNNKINRASVLPVHTGSIHLQPQELVKPAFHMHDKMNRPA